MRARRSPFTVVAAWLVTGPLGHLGAAVADWLGFARARARARLRPRRTRR
jgi:hypothetical protein